MIIEKDKEVLLKRLKEAEEMAARCRAEAGYCLNVLQQCEADLQKALQEKSFAYVERARLNLSTVMNAPERLDFSRAFLKGYAQGWNEYGSASKALEEITACAEQISAEDGTTNAQLKERIIKLAESNS
ncbi:MAG TPA: hypothetical protein VEF04_15890 [Blastocatellia bacterium]|nr:hypothetical protein [Blastocatellia bacterium]